MVTIPIDNGVIVISVWGVLAIAAIPLAIVGFVVLLVSLFGGRRQRSD
jgi:hypothetical protein